MPTAFNYPVSGGGSGNVGYGTYASRPATPSVGDRYLCSDINVDLICVIAGTWQPPVDPLYGNVSTNIRCEGNNGDTILRDEILGNAWNMTGNGSLSNAVTPPFGSTWYFTNTTGIGYVTIPIALINDYAIDFWMNVTSIAATQENYITIAGLAIYHSSASNVLKLFNGSDRIIGTVAIPTNTNLFIHLERVATITKLFINNVQQGSNFTDVTQYQPTSIILGCGSISSTSTHANNVYFKGLRITNGNGRTSAIPTDFFPNKG